MSRRGYCIFIDTFFEGPVPCVKDADENFLDGIESVCVFPTEREAQLEIVDNMMTRLQQFIDGERDFDDAVTLDEYVVAVEVLPDGTIFNAAGNGPSSVR